MGSQAVTSQSQNSFSCKSDDLCATFQFTFHGEIQKTQQPKAKDQQARLQVKACLL